MQRFLLHQKTRDMGKDRFNKFITTNPWLKLASFVLAILLWVFVVLKGHSVVIMDIPVELKNIPVKLEIVDRPETVSITVEGQERILKKLREDDIHLVVNLGNILKGETFVPLSADNITLPEAFTVGNISPQSIRLVFDEKAEKDVPVRAVILGEPFEGYVVDGIKVDPETVKIEGPESLITRVYSVKTEPLDITGVTGSVQYNAFLDMTEENIRLNTAKVKVNVTVKKAK